MQYCPEYRPDKEKFLNGVFALACIDTLLGEEKAKSARYNRVAGAHDSIVRVCDTYFPDGLNTAKLSALCNFVDGPIKEVINTYAADLEAIMDSWQLPEGKNE